jgi:DNA-binding NtrC family response regulator
VLHDLANLDTLQFPWHCTVAVLAAGGLEGGRPSATAARHLRERGFTVIAYQDDANTAPLAARCGLFLAGCTTLLDSAAGNFLQELKQQLLAAICDAAQKSEEERRVSQAMRRMGIVGQSPSMLDVFRQLVRLSALSDLPTVITGETGTGKELLARALFRLDRKRRSGPFIALNCGSISSTLAESELFGHRRGAFTGADRERIGLIRAAHGGVLFLDEIGELAGPLQAKLLRVLQEGRVLAVGEDHEVSVDVRIIAATNRDLAQMIREGTFREDLFHRLNVITIHVPPLRERRTDIPLLIEHFAGKYRELNDLAGGSIGAGFIEAVCQLELPGNARQLENLVRWALIHNNRSGPLGLHDLPPDVWKQVVHRQASSSGDQSGQPEVPPDPVQSMASYPASLLAANGWNLSRSLHVVERSILEIALRESRGNQSQAARLLGITPRSVYNKLRRYGSG